MTDQTNSRLYAGAVFPDEWDQDEGIPDVNSVAIAIQVWSMFQTETCTVRQAAIAFNVDDAQIRQAVEAHYWMFIDGPDDDPTKQTIELEGE